MLKLPLLLSVTRILCCIFRHSCFMRHSANCLHPITRTLSKTPNKHYFSTSSRLLGVHQNEHDRPFKVAIVGGGLAGLSTAYHLLEKSEGQVQITMVDPSPVGTGGASAVAGGLIHPLSPRGKLVHHGMEGLQATNHLIQVAQQHHDPSLVLRDHLYRVALTPSHCQQLQATAEQFPRIAEWKTPSQLSWIYPNDNQTILGALLLHNGCQVIHVPSYLQGLWEACRAQYGSAIEWVSQKWGAEDADMFDAIVYAAGSGMMSDEKLLSRRKDDLPVSLVRGQSLEMEVDQETIDGELSQPALLCGKYVSPTPNPNTVLVGATYEYQSVQWDRNEVITELKERTCKAAPWAWRGRVSRVTSGVRVQSRRGRHGRLPVVGRWHGTTGTKQNTWIFTGLSSRGLLYHGLYGSLLADAMLQNSESRLEQEGLLWWTKN